MKTVTVFRCGAIGQPFHKPYVRSSFRFFDAGAPKGRVLREGAIFASPERSALTPWIEMKHRKKQKANTFWSLNGSFEQDTLVRHLEVKLDESLFVYDADLFGAIHLDALSNGLNGDLVDVSPYWESGIPLGEWASSNFANTPTAGSWEVLLTPHHLRTVRIER